MSLGSEECRNKGHPFQTDTLKPKRDSGNPIIIIVITGLSRPPAKVLRATDMAPPFFLVFTTSMRCSHWPKVTQ